MLTAAAGYSHSRLLILAAMHQDAGAVKTAAALEASSPRAQAAAQKKQTTTQNSQLELEAPEEQAW
jgi:hypothetical protein